MALTLDQLTEKYKKGLTITEAELKESGFTLDQIQSSVKSVFFEDVEKTEAPDEGGVNWNISANSVGGLDASVS